MSDPLIKGFNKLWLAVLYFGGIDSYLSLKYIAKVTAYWIFSLGGVKFGAKHLQS